LRAWDCAIGGTREIAARSFPAVAMIVTEDFHSQPLAIGSGFFVKEKIVATNAHVVEGAAGGYIKVLGDDRKHEIRGFVAIDPKHDLVLLEVESAAPQLPLGDFGKAAVGDTVYSVGSPKGLEGTFAQWIISSIREVNG